VRKNLKFSSCHKIAPTLKLGSKGWILSILTALHKEIALLFIYIKPDQHGIWMNKELKIL
jgi:hypothetical protein